VDAAVKAYEDAHFPYDYIGLAQLEYASLKLYSYSIIPVPSED